LGVHCCNEGAVRGDDKFGGGGAARVRGDCVGGASLSIEAVQREEADEVEGLTRALSIVPKYITV
jgi:hypothetical protein